MSKPAVLLRTSERSSFKTCEQQWWWAYVDRVKPTQTGYALKFGDLIHRALAEYYPLGLKRGPHPTDTFTRFFDEQQEIALRAGFRDENGEWQEYRDLGIAMLDGYVLHFKEEDKLYKVIATEQTFRVSLWGTKAWYVGTVDGLFQDRSTKKYLIRDYKTTGKYGDFNVALALNDQAGAYWTYGVDWMVKQGYIEKKIVSDIQKMEYRFLKKTKPDDRPRNDDGYYLNNDGTISKKQPTPIFWSVPVYRTEQNRKIIKGRVRTELAEMLRIRDGKRQPIKNPGPLHLPNCPGCGYRDMCELHEAGADWETFRDSVMEVWDPYESHSDYAL